MYYTYCISTIHIVYLHCSFYISITIKLTLRIMHIKMVRVITNKIHDGSYYYIYCIYVIN